MGNSVKVEPGQYFLDSAYFENITCPHCNTIATLDTIRKVVRSEEVTSDSHQTYIYENPQYTEGVFAICRTCKQIIFIYMESDTRTCNSCKHRICGKDIPIEELNSVYGMNVSVDSLRDRFLFHVCDYFKIVLADHNNRRMGECPGVDANDTKIDENKRCKFCRSFDYRIGSRLNIEQTCNNYKSPCRRSVTEDTIACCDFVFDPVNEAAYKQRMKDKGYLPLDI